MALLLAVLLGVFAALSAVVVPTTGRYHTRSALSPGSSITDFQSDDWRREVKIRARKYGFHLRDAFGTCSDGFSRFPMHENIYLVEVEVHLPQ
ncbi:hypothetical protein EAH_00050520 [Eimeria acervulina]|uniref:Uncharacterized protein n=1 Tax=Eimeria acervulina TaxID=5801 RepID=U6GL53_EIMAC|nr:hypothetical protein EAH_00050520 [Eimeria acervulina]CDI80307.1 hypothetical protein EAH_00050520 [Eimeria acervulina]